MTKKKKEIKIKKVKIKSCDEASNTDEESEESSMEYIVTGFGEGKSTRYTRVSNQYFNSFKILIFIIASTFKLAGQ